MLGFLQTIAEAIVSVGILFLNAIIDFINLLFEGITVTAAGTFALLPEMPTGEKFDSTFLEYANWFYPFGAVASAFGACVTMYIVWLAVRYLLRLVRAA